mmetsp:Transcript_118237/g.339197  ORF Transcript_118237/g.339197 Transcript_118237/m.339197 type:complete len:291 (-) Transcript_118237:268-1140(-)|eukprot:CAMPEP_0170348966 /NCGR_PEP_ID=MMETSP0116_2-20130129/75766_1 /TAXON_ID=400756 /ORGANISM="Durinskia baltica, Strain CSIRO CS-38" /LENGTH=290 /DNA_ID=CAMNT_0010602835 /DNA_START=82 /DNA_END=954 /DNA_ORIENTATION=-
MKFSLLAIQLVACSHLISAFSPVQYLDRKISVSTRQQGILFSSQWDDEDDDIATQKPASFEDAGVGLQQEDDKKRMDDMGDFDANPSYNSADIERFRRAIKERADALGIEESKMSQEAIQAAQERAKAGMANQGAGQMLDLSQITQTAPRGKDDDLPSFLYEPEDEMTEEEMKEADPDGQLSIPQWAAKELSATSWPTPLAALKEVIVLVATIALTAGIIIGWDNVLRNAYTEVGFIPRPEDIMQGAENLVLPEGWTNGMSEDDFMKFQDEVGKVASSSPAISSGSLSDL